MAKNPQVGDQLINDSGTCVTVVETPEDGLLDPGTVPAVMVDALFKAGYRRLDKDDVIPTQAHEAGAVESFRRFTTRPIDQ